MATKKSAAKKTATKKTTAKGPTKKTLKQAARTYNSQLQNGATPKAARRAYESYGVKFPKGQKGRIGVKASAGQSG